MSLKDTLRSRLPTDPLSKNTRVQRVLTHIPSDASILDIGCVNHSLDNDDQNWLHGQLCERSDDVTGLDYLDEPIEAMADIGYDVVCADAEEFSLGREYEVVVAGELIEHLSNPGKFLDRANEHLEDEGKLVLTTPNPWYLFHVLASYAGTARWNDEHSAWFDEIVLEELLGRHGFDVEKIEYVKPSPWKWQFVHKNLERWAVFPFRLLGMQPASGNRLLVVARKTE